MVVVRRLAWSLVLAVLCLGAVQPSSAQPNNAQPRPGRFLLLVEKSGAAGRIDDAIRQTVFDLIYKGANGNMAFGSNFEIWTFNDSVTTRGFEAAQLLYETRLDAATKATLFLRALPNEGEANMAALTDVLRRVAAGNDQLTVLLITEGGAPITGTPIDEQLNDIYRVHYPSMRQSNSPFITTFRLRDGGIAAYAVSADVATLAMPPMPDRLPVANRPRTPPATRESPAAPARREPVESIIITAESRSEPAATNEPPATDPDAAIEPDDEPPVADVAVANAEPPIPEPEDSAPVEPLTANEEVAATTPPIGTNEPTDPAPRQPAVQSEIEPQTEPDPAPQVTLEPKVEAPAESEPATVPQDESTAPVVIEEVPPPPLEAVVAPGVEATSEQPGQLEQPAVTPPVVNPGPASTSAPVDEPVVQPTVTNPPATAEPRPSNARTQPGEPGPMESSNGEGDDGVVAVTGLEWLRSGGLFVAGTIFLLLALFFAWMLYRRTRRIAEASLISKTYGRDRDRR